MKMFHCAEAALHVWLLNFGELRFIMYIGVWCGVCNESDVRQQNSEQPTDRYIIYNESSHKAIERPFILNLSIF